MRRPVVVVALGMLLVIILMVITMSFGFGYIPRWLFVVLGGVVAGLFITLIGRPTERAK